MLVHYVRHVVGYCIPILILISSSNNPRNYGLVILYIDYLVCRYVDPVGLQVAYYLYNTPFFTSLWKRDSFHV
jgi:hypothetical protein